MRIAAESIAKRYSYSWIIKDFSYTFSEGSRTGIIGPNGSGKSTLMQMLCAHLPPSKGQLSYGVGGKEISAENAFRYLSMVAPYTDVVQEFTLRELFDFHRRFRPLRAGVDYQKFIDLLQLPPQKAKQIQYFSSGMNQRVQLALAILSDTPLLLLDEPTSYLDTSAKRWMFDLLAANLEGRTLIVASNDEADFQLCSDRIEL